MGSWSSSSYDEQSDFRGPFGYFSIWDIGECSRAVFPNPVFRDQQMVHVLATHRELRGNRNMEPLLWADPDPDELLSLPECVEYLWSIGPGPSARLS